MSNGHGRSTEGFGISREESVRLIVRTSLENGVTNPRLIAYILATAQHETRNFTAPEEDFGRAQARKLGYRGGEEYFGRGYVHLTHRDNYEAMDQRLGLQGALVRDPALATDPAIAARILVIGMRDGLFTGRRLDVYINERSTDFHNARRTVNGVVASKPWSVRAAQECERFAREWERDLPELIEEARRHPGGHRAPASGSPMPHAENGFRQGDGGPAVRQLQHRLNALGMVDRAGRRLDEDGDFGRRTSEAVIAFQLAHRLEATGIADSRTLAALATRSREHAHAAGGNAAAAEGQNRSPQSAILRAAEQHYLSGGKRFEYGRPDLTLRNSGGNGRTDGSRIEQDLDGDGRRGVDCSTFVWRGLRNAGYEVPASPFTTRALFSGSEISRYARQHFDVISADAARRDRGGLQPGDILLFKDRHSDGQHVGIFKGYDANGGIQFIGSQVQTGPAQAAAGEGSYWNGGRFEIVGALRAKAEFQVRAPLHGRDDGHQGASRAPDVAGRAGPARASAPGGAPDPAEPVRTTAVDSPLRHGHRGPAVETLQRRLADLGYRGDDGSPLAIDGVFGTNTRHALSAFQRDHGLQGLGVAGPRTALALDRAEGALMSHPCHAHHALYAQVLEKVHAEERARGVASGHHSQRIAAALAVECLREGITRVDRVELNRDASLARAVQVSPLRDEPGLNRGTDGIDTAQAAQRTMRESTEQLRQVAANVQAQQREAEPVARHPPAMRAQAAIP